MKANATRIGRHVRHTWMRRKTEKYISRRGARRNRDKVKERERERDINRLDK